MDTARINLGYGQEKRARGGGEHGAYIFHLFNGMACNSVLVTEQFPTR